MYSWALAMARSRLTLAGWLVVGAVIPGICLVQSERDGFMAGPVLGAGGASAAGAGRIRSWSGWPWNYQRGYSSSQEIFRVIFQLMPDIDLKGRG